MQLYKILENIYCKIFSNLTQVETLSYILYFYNGSTDLSENQTMPNRVIPARCVCDFTANASFQVSLKIGQKVEIYQSSVEANYRLRS